MYVHIKKIFVKFNQNETDRYKQAEQFTENVEARKTLLFRKNNITYEILLNSSQFDQHK